MKVAVTVTSTVRVRVSVTSTVTVKVTMKVMVTVAMTAAVTAAVMVAVASTVAVYPPHTLHAPAAAALPPRQRPAWETHTPRRPRAGGPSRRGVLGLRRSWV